MLEKKYVLHINYDDSATSIERDYDDRPNEETIINLIQKYEADSASIEERYIIKK